MSYIFNFVYIIQISYGKIDTGSRRGRGRLRKHGLPPRTHAPPTTSTTPTLTTPTSDGCFVPPGPHIQEFVMIPNPGYHNSGPQPSFLQQASSPPCPHLQEVRPAVSLLLCLPLPSISLIHKVPRPPRPPSYSWSLNTIVNPGK